MEWPSEPATPEVDSTENIGRLALTPERQREMRREVLERSHTLEGVREHFVGRADRYAHLRKFGVVNYTEAGIQAGFKKASKYTELTKAVEQGNYEKALRAVELELSDGLQWNEKNELGRKTVFTGADYELNEHKFLPLPPEDFVSQPENTLAQECLRENADVLTDKLYEQNGKSLPPVTLDDVISYFKGVDADMALPEDDSSVVEKKYVIANRNYGAMADQIDTSLAANIQWTEEIKAGNKDTEQMVGKKYGTGYPLAALLGQIENLRGYRKLLRDSMKASKA